MSRAFAGNSVLQQYGTFAGNSVLQQYGTFAGNSVLQQYGTLTLWSSGNTLSCHKEMFNETDNNISNVSFTDINMK